MNLSHYTVLAELFEYPGEDFGDKVDRVSSFLEGAYPKAAEELSHFRTILPRDDMDAMRELYTRSFDVQAITTLDIGYVMFGDDYKRGELLSNLSREHREVSNDCGTELGDFLPNLLRLLAKLEDTALVNDLIQELLAPTLKMMIAEFSTERITTKDKMYKRHHKTIIWTSAETRTVYRGTLKALLEVIESDFEIVVKPPMKANRKFLPMLNDEMSIEKSE